MALLNSDDYLQAIVQMAEHVQSLAKKEQYQQSRLANPAEVQGCQVKMLADASTTSHVENARQLSLQQNAAVCRACGCCSNNIIPECAVHYRKTADPAVSCPERVPGRCLDGCAAAHKAWHPSCSVTGKSHPLDLNDFLGRACS